MTLRLAHDFADGFGDSIVEEGTYAMDGGGLRIVAKQTAPWICQWFHLISGFPASEIASIQMNVQFGPNISAFLLGFRVVYNNKISVQVARLDWYLGKVQTIDVNGPPHHWTDLCDLPSISRDGSEHLMNVWVKPSTYSLRRLYVDGDLIWNGNAVQTPTNLTANNQLMAKANVVDAQPPNDRWARLMDFQVNW